MTTTAPLPEETELWRALADADRALADAPAEEINAARARRRDAIRRLLRADALRVEYRVGSLVEPKTPEVGGLGEVVGHTADFRVRVCWNAAPEVSIVSTDEIRALGLSSSDRVEGGAPGTPDWDHGCVVGVTPAGLVDVAWRGAGCCAGAPHGDIRPYDGTPKWGPSVE
jgi:hypothetical protein